MHSNHSGAAAVGGNTAITDNNLDTDEYVVTSTVITATVRLPGGQIELCTAAAVALLQ